MRRVAVSLAVTMIAAANAAWAADFPKAFEETLEQTVEGYGGPTQMHNMSDGKGHERMECTDSKGETQISLMDYLQHTTTSTMDMNGQKRYMKLALPAYEGLEAYKQGTKDLGTKVIDGHPCHGWEKTFPNGQVNRIWVDDNTEATVLTEGLGPGPKITTKLKTWTATAPTFSMDLSSDYKVYP